jgi:bifunctional non-homologous end joining protein LigD
MPRSRVLIPADADHTTLTVAGREVRLTNLRKLFWPERGITKGALLQYYADVATVLLPHIRNRAMVMKRYPQGAGGPFFFMKRAPTPRPAWIRTCAIEHGPGNAIDFPVIDDLPSLLWIINLGGDPNPGTQPPRAIKAPDNTFNRTKEDQKKNNPPGRRPRFCDLGLP